MAMMAQLILLNVTSSKAWSIKPLVEQAFDSFHKDA